MVARVHALLPPAWDWAGVGGRPGASEEDRERAELQRAYYAFLNALAQNGLLPALQARALGRSPAVVLPCCGRPCAESVVPPAVQNLLHLF